MAQRTDGRPSENLNVMVVDEDKCHANSTKSMLSPLNYYVTVYTSPIEAFGFLENHAQDVDFVLLVAVRMEELDGFQFLEAAKQKHKNLQVIMMSTETTMYTMKRSVELGARFLVKKPLDADTIQNIWQHLDLKVLRLNKMKYLFRGVGDKAQHGEEVRNSLVQQKDGSNMRTHLIWTPYLQRKFIRALRILGQSASPKKIKIIMNVDSVSRKQISTHLQKHWKRMERKEDMTVFMKSGPTVPYTHLTEVQPTKGRRTMTQSFGDTRDGDADVFAEMRRALQLGMVYDESRYSGDPYREGTDDVPGYILGADGAVHEPNGSNSSSFDQAVAETDKATDAQENVPKAPLVGLVDYPDSEDLIK